MPPQGKVLRRPTTRSRSDTNTNQQTAQDTSDLIIEQSMLSSSSLLVPSSPRVDNLSSEITHRPTATNTSHNGNSSPREASNTATTKKTGRGPSVGKSIEKEIKKNGGKLLEIEFKEGFTKPIKYASLFANEIGIVVRHSPELDFTGSWLDVPEMDKLPVYAGLDQWFTVKGWPKDPLVKSYVDSMFYNAYKHWKGVLSRYHKQVVEVGEDPKANPPYEWISLDKWRMQCNYFSSPEFQEKSKKNVENRSHLPYPHTSGSKAFVTRLMEMENRNEVDNFGNTHLRKNGEYVNVNAAQKHKEMKRKVSQVNEDEDNPPEREIMMEVLGTRSGYERGMGYGVVHSRKNKRVRCEPTQLEETQEQLSITQNELQDAVTLINSQQEQLKLSEEQRQKQDQEIAMQKTEIESLKESHNEMKKMLLGLLTQKLS